MTGGHHDSDALIAALRSPALPREQTGESAAVTAMLEALPAAAPPRPGGLRSRRGVAVAAVTVASLGVGGLVAAGPGFFLPAADRPTETPSDDGGPAPTDPRPGISVADPSNDAQAEPPREVPPTTAALVVGTIVGSAPEAGLAFGDASPGPAGADEDVPGEPCDAATHGEAVSDAARSSVPDDAESSGQGEMVREVATSDCGKPEQRDTPANTAPGQTGDTPANTAPGQTGDTPANTAPAPKADTPANTAPAPKADTPAKTAPAPKADTPGNDTGGNGRP